MIQCRSSKSPKNRGESTRFAPLLRSVESAAGRKHLGHEGLEGCKREKIVSVRSGPVGETLRDGVSDQLIGQKRGSERAWLMLVFSGAGTHRRALRLILMSEPGSPLLSRTSRLVRCQSRARYRSIRIRCLLERYCHGGWHQTRGTDLVLETGTLFPFSPQRRPAGRTRRSPPRRSIRNRLAPRSVGRRASCVAKARSGNTIAARPNLRRL